MQDKADLPYRPCVGIMLANRHGTIFVGQRIDAKEGDAWQMPQGGIDPGETAEAALIRELGEETGIAPHLVDVIARSAQEHIYDLPDELIGWRWAEADSLVDLIVPFKRPVYRAVVREFRDLL